MSKQRSRSKRTRSRESTAIPPGTSANGAGDQAYAAWAMEREQRAEERRQRVRELPGDEFILDHPELEASWGDGSKVIWPIGEPLMIAAAPGVGKTTIGGQLMYRRAGVHEGPLLDLSVRPMPEGQRALYLAMDRPPQIARSLARSVSEGDRELLHDRILVHQGPLPFILNERQPYELAEWIQEFGDICDVYIDSLKDLAVGLAKDEIGALVNMAIQECCVRGIQVAELHHHRKTQKSGEGPRTLDDVYGSAWLTAGAGSVIALDGDAGATHVRLRHLKPPHDAVGPLDLVHDHPAGTTSVRDRETDVLSYVLKRGKEGATAAEVATVCFGGSEKRHKAKANRELNKLKDVLERVEGKPGGEGGGEVAPRWRKRRTKAANAGTRRGRRTKAANGGERS